jgi:hypothetical protein
MVICRVNPAFRPEFTVLSSGALPAGAHPAIEISGDWGSNEHGEHF